MEQIVKAVTYTSVTVFVLVLAAGLLLIRAYRERPRKPVVKLDEHEEKFSQN